MAALSNPRGLLVSLFLVLGVAIVGVAALFWRQSADRPTATVIDLAPQLGRLSTLELELEAPHGQLDTIDVSLVQAGQRRSLSSVALADSVGSKLFVSLPIDLAASGAQEGEGILEVHATDNFWRPRGPGSAPAFRAPVQVDLTPPAISVKAATRYPEAGGAGVATLRASEASEVSIRVGDRDFRAYPDPNGGQDLYVAFFALAIDHDPQVRPLAVARDAAGNESSAALPVVLKEANLKTGSVNLNANWLASKLPELLPHRASVAQDEIAAAFLEVSVQQRAEAVATRHRLAADSAPEPLWKEVFRQMPNASAVSGFGVRRTYRFDGRDLDTKDHEGYDLASTRHAAIPAANTGRVVFAGPLTLYGNTVILDHGLGLMTLYGHCSTLEVAVGDEVTRGETIARSGSTGLAVGDHLHFEVVVGGVAVNPLQWWDAQWIRTHVTEPLREGGTGLF